MIIKCDKEAQKLIAKLADSLLKAYGIQVYNEIGVMMNSITILENTVEEIKE